MTSILERSGTAIAPPCWPQFRNMATPLSIWASWETSMPSDLASATVPFSYAFVLLISPVYLSKDRPVFSFSVISLSWVSRGAWHLYVYVCLCPAAPMTFSTLWMKASAVLMSSSPQEECLWERRYSGRKSSGRVVLYWHHVVADSQTAELHSSFEFIILWNTFFGVLVLHVCWVFLRSLIFFLSNIIFRTTLSRCWISIFMLRSILVVCSWNQGKKKNPLQKCFTNNTYKWHAEGVMWCKMTAGGEFRNYVCFCLFFQSPNNFCHVGHRWCSQTNLCPPR